MQRPACWAEKGQQQHKTVLGIWSRPRTGSHCHILRFAKLQGISLNSDRRLARWVLPWSSYEQKNGNSSELIENMQFFFCSSTHPVQEPCLVLLLGQMNSNHTGFLSLHTWLSSRDLGVICGNILKSRANVGTFFEFMEIVDRDVPLTNFAKPPI